MPAIGRAEIAPHELSGDTLPDFIMTCPKLRVCISDGGFIETRDLERLHRQGWPKLSVFGPYWAVHCSDTLTRCAAALAGVRTYHMHCSASWQTAAAEALAYMPRLHTVCLYRDPAALLPYVGQHCSQLRVLRLMQNVKPEYSALVGETLIAALPGLTKLEELQWRLSKDLGDVGLMALAQHCPNLRSLDCACRDVTDAGLIALVRGCPALRTLLLWRCGEGQVTDAFLHDIAQHCSLLEELRLPFSWKTSLFSHAAVSGVLAACPHLRVLHVPWDPSALVVPAGRLRRLTIRVATNYDAPVWP